MNNINNMSQCVQCKQYYSGLHQCFTQDSLQQLGYLQYYPFNQPIPPTDTLWMFMRNWINDLCYENAKLKVELEHLKDKE